MDTPANQARLLPKKPGVYLFRDANGTVIYVGKASNLHNRVGSYFTSKPLTHKHRKIISYLTYIDFIIAGSEQEAIILENNLIKNHKPRYNVRLKDDKSYPYLKITLAEEWPRAHLTRRLADDGSRYFGPFASVTSLRQTMNLINRLFPYRTCKKAITGTDPRPCLKFHIKKCSGPCIGAINPREYKEIINQVILFLEGKQDRVIRDLKKRMAEASNRLEFERAASFRDQILAIEQIMEQQKVVSIRKINEDIIAIAQTKNEACAQILFIRSGKMQGNDHFVLEGTQDEKPGKVITSFIEQFYSAGADIPPQILLHTEPEDRVLIESWLENKLGRRVRLTVPHRGAKKQLVQMAYENASEMLEQSRNKWLADTGKTSSALEELRTQLQLPRMPQRIECYDISNIRGTAAVGSMAVFEQGSPKPAQYRRFKIKAISGIDDYAMMQEVLRRRFSRRLRPQDEQAENSWPLQPDLVLIDGGRGHLNAILTVMREMEIDDVPIASIAKENEEIFIPESANPIILLRNSQALYLLQRIRDEAHRFAISYHTNIRKKAALSSRLDDIPGIGPKRKRVLLRTFGSLKGIKTASINDIASVPGMNRMLAEQVKVNL
jgi:excinuclease ABC subunit C